jgi:hypothetical protein
MDHEKQSNNRESALLVILVLIYFKHIEFAMLISIIGILYPAPFTILSKTLKFLGPKIHAAASYILLNVLFVILVIPVGLIKNILSNKLIESNTKIYSREDFERPF